MPSKPTAAIFCFLLSSLFLFSQTDFRSYFGNPDPWSDQFVSGLVSLPNKLIAVGYADRPELRQQQLAIYFVDKAVGTVTDSVFLPSDQANPVIQVVANELGEFAVLRYISDDRWQFMFFTETGENTAVLDIDLSETGQAINSAALEEDGSLIYLVGPCRNCATPAELIRQNADGEIRWRQNIFGGNLDREPTLKIISPTELLVSGAKQDTGIIAKYALSGELLWETRPTETVDDMTRRLTHVFGATTFGGEGNIMITGNSMFGDQVYLLMDAEGDIVKVYDEYFRRLNGEEVYQFTAAGDTLVFSKGTRGNTQYEIIRVEEELVSLNRSGILNGDFGFYLLEGTEVFTYGKIVGFYDENLFVSRRKLTPFNNVDWYTNYGDPGYIHREDAVKTLVFPDESFVVTANTTENGTDFQQAVIHFTPQGEEDWRAVLSESPAPNSSMLSLMTAENGDILTSYALREGFIQVARISTSGEIIWQHAGERSNAVERINDDNLVEFADGRIGYLSTSVESDHFNELRFTVLSADGVQLEERYYPGLSTSDDYTAFQLSNGFALFSGISTTDQSLKLFAYDLALDSTVWSHELNDQTGTGGKVLKHLQDPETGNIYVLTRERNPLSGQLDLWLTSLSSTGTVNNRELILGATFASRGSGMHLTQEGEIQLTYVTGDRQTPGPEEVFQYIVEWRNPDDLTQIKAGRIRNTTGFFALEDSAPIGDDGSLYVGLGEASPGEGVDMLILRTTDDMITSERIPLRGALEVAVSPNPTNGTMTITLPESSGSTISWQIISAGGKTVLFGSNPLHGARQLSVDLSREIPGIYFFLGLDNHKQRYTKKIVKH